MLSHRSHKKQLSINTQNLDFPDIGKVVELRNDHGIVELANGKLAYAFFSSHTKEEVIKLGRKFAVGTVVHVAIQRDMPKKRVETTILDGNDQLIEMDTINIQELQRTYPHKGIITELTSDYAVICLADGTKGNSIFSIAEKQLMQERSEPSLVVGQSVSVHLRAAAATGIPHSMDLQEVGSPEPQTAFLISPVGRLKPVVSPDPSTDKRTLFSLLKELSTPPAVASSSVVKLPAVVSTVALPTIESQIKREGVVLNPKRTSATKEFRVATPSDAAATVQVMNFMDAAEKKIIRSLRRKPIAVAPLQFKNQDERPQGHIYFPSTAAKDNNHLEIHAASVSRNVVVLSQLASKQAMFPSIGSQLAKPSTSKSVSAESKANTNSELFQVLKDLIVHMKSFAASRDEKKLMKNLFNIVNTGARDNEKICFIISEAARHNMISVNKTSMYSFARSRMILNTLDGFCKVVASIQSDKMTADILPLLKSMLPGSTLVAKSSFPSLTPFSHN